MIITHCYKIKPTSEESAKIDYWHLAAKEALELCSRAKVRLVQQNQVSNRPMLNSIMSYW